MGAVPRLLPPPVERLAVLVNEPLPERRSLPAGRQVGVRLDVGAAEWIVPAVEEGDAA